MSTYYGNSNGYSGGYNKNRGYSGSGGYNKKPFKKVNKKIETRKKKTAYSICKEFYLHLVEHWSYRDGKPMPTFEQYCKDRKKAEVASAKKMLQLWSNFDFYEETRDDTDREFIDRFVNTNTNSDSIIAAGSTTKKKVVVVKKSVTATKSEDVPSTTPTREKGKVYIVKKKPTPTVEE